MILQVDNLSMRYGNDPKVLDDVSFEIKTGEITSLVGRNGSGKTTILKILTDILRPQSGTIAIDGKDLKDYPELKKEMAYLPDSFDFFAYNDGEDAMEYYSMIYPDMDKEFVREEASKLKIDLKKSIRKQSKGNKTILGLLIILATNAPFILLDEVLDGIDVLNKSKIIGYILDALDQGRSILISSHQLAELQGISDNVLYLSLEGKLDVSDTEKNSQISKYQIVSTATLDPQILKDMVIRQHIGRVYTVLVDDNLDIQDILDDPTVVQHDELPVLLEDLFYWEDNHEQHTDND